MKNSFLLFQIRKKGGFHRLRGNLLTSDLFSVIKYTSKPAKMQEKSGFPKHGKPLFLFLTVELNLPVFPDALNVALMAHGNIGIVAAQKYLVTLGDDIAIADTGIDSCLGAAVADGLDLLNGIRHFHQAHGAGDRST